MWGVRSRGTREKPRGSREYIAVGWRSRSRTKAAQNHHGSSRTKQEQNTNKKRHIFVGKLSFEARGKLENSGVLGFEFPDTGTARLRQGFTKPTLRFIDTIHARRTDKRKANMVQKLQEYFLVMTLQP